MADTSAGAPTAFDGGVRRRPAGGRLRALLDAHLVGHSDSADYSPEWHRKFAHTPTWCDADMALQQINRGAATGNRIALYARAFFQHALYRLGCVIQRHPWFSLLGGLLLFAMCGSSLVRHDIIIETDLVKLWVSQGGRLDEELNFLSRIQRDAQGEAGQARHKRAPPSDGQAVQPVNAISTTTNGSAQRHTPELPRENGLGGGFQVVIETPSNEGENILTRDSLLRHVELMQEIAHFSVDYYGEKWTLSDICFKPPGPQFHQVSLRTYAFNVGNVKGPLAKLMATLLDKIIPCIWITPIDCFWEGAKPLGPFPPLNLGEEVSSFVTSLPPGNVTWKNLNPTEVVKEVGSLFDLGPIENFFDRAGIGAAYLDRPCIDALDAECPKTAPNYFDRCAALEKFDAWNAEKPEDGRIKLEKDEPIASHEKANGKKGNDSNANAEKVVENLLNDLFQNGRKKRQAPVEATTAKRTSSDDYYAYEDDKDYDKGNVTESKPKKDPKAEKCELYGKSLLKWMRNNRDKWGQFLAADELPKEPNFGDVMTGGCKGFGKKIMRWPEPLIMGGLKRDGEKLKSAEALQSVFLVSSPFDIYLRFKDGKRDSKPRLDRDTWSRSKAHDILVAWQRNFTEKLYGHPRNFEADIRQVHPLASTSIADMLEQFSQFQYTIILIGYALMVVYAAVTQARWSRYWLAVKSYVLLAIIGVMLVTFSSICGLGLSTTLGINFNAATTQIVPFLSLGLGIDDMFLLLHNYDHVVDTVQRNEIGSFFVEAQSIQLSLGVLLKETGMSIMITSINNVLAFVSGIILPIPALRSFCSQTAILLTFNLISLMFIFPAFIAVDLRRLRAGKRDLAGCCAGGSSDKVVSVDDSNGHVPEKQHKAAAGPLPQKEELSSWTVVGFLDRYYMPFIKKSSVKIAIVVISIVTLVFGLVGIYSSTLGLELSDVLPEDTAPAAFLRAREKYFSFYPMYAVLKGRDIDFPRQQQQIDQYRQAISTSPFVIKVDGKPSEEYWLSLMRSWLTSLQKSLDDDLAKGAIDPETGLTRKGLKPKPESVVARKLVCSFGLNYNCSGRLGTVRLLDETTGEINQDAFYNYLTGWYNVDNMMYYVSQASFYPVPPAWNPKNDFVPPAAPMLYSQIPFYLNDLISTPSIVRMIEEVREICDDFSAAGLPNFPSGLAFTFWEQYLTLRLNLFLAILIISLAVFTVISLLVFNPWAAGMVMVIVVVMCIQLGGFMGLFGIKMNPISAVTLITAVGIGVEFTAHIVLAFLTALGTTEQRMQSCLEHMFVPVVHGSLSTLLGMIMLIFSEFDFVIKYFFVVMTVLVMLGIFNGLCLLPVLLSWFGPDCEVQPVDGSHSLLPPPPLSKSRSVEDAAAAKFGQLRRRKGVAAAGDDVADAIELEEGPPIASSNGNARAVQSNHERSA